VETRWNDFGGTTVAALCKHGDFGILNPVENLWNGGYGRKLKDACRGLLINCKETVHKL